MVQAGKGGQGGEEDQSAAIISEPQSDSRRHLSPTMETVPRSCCDCGDGSPQSRCYWYHTGGWHTKVLAAKGSLGACG